MLGISAKTCGRGAFSRCSYLRAASAFRFPHDSFFIEVNSGDNFKNEKGPVTVFLIEYHKIVKYFHIICKKSPSTLNSTSAHRFIKH